MFIWHIQRSKFSLIANPTKGNKSFKREKLMYKAKGAFRIIQKARVAFK